ncbi:Carbonic anhydrase [Pseudomonas syringae pv. maculicola]|uniref:Carbonic anhydrase n=1 Tax=Pseudomonas syringae pv. maculicola TaxID=59511 RepID=A0A3M6B7T7_PSEYM|nr:Carbonic anhydrase [Pseudomonas syringae pv. maculicola]
MLEDSVKSNVQRTVKRLRTASEPTLVNPIRDGKVRVVGAYYSLENGQVEFFDV